ncbi:MAG: gluconokinase [Leeuwenhoekiella sp.]
MKLALIVDIGTTNIKVGLVNSKGIVLSQKSAENVPFRPERGAYENDPETLLEAIGKLSTEVAAPHKEEIAFIGLSGYQFGFLPLDEQGNPLGGMMTLLDNRSKVVMEDLKSLYSYEDIYTKTGCPPLSTYAFARLHWLKNYKPDIFAKAARYADLKSFLIEKWTGKFVTEPSIAGATQLLNVQTSDWDEDLLKWAGIDRSKLPKIVAGDNFSGELTAQAAAKLGLNESTPVLPGLYDGAAMILGMGGFGEEIAVCNLGTTAMFRGCSSSPLLDDPAKMRLQTYPLLPNYWVTGGAVNNAGVSLSWFKDLLNSSISFEEFLEEVDATNPGADGLICLPYLTGERDPRIGNEASAVFFGLKEYHERKHMVRSILEGITFSLNLIREAVTENGFQPKLLRVGGSGAKSDLWLNIIANTLNVKVQRMSTPESALVGISIIGFKACGVYESIQSATELMVTPGEIFEPSDQIVQKYKNTYDFFKRVLKTMKNLYELEEGSKNTVGDA